MISTNRIVTGNSDASTHMQSNVLAYRQPGDQSKPEVQARESAGSAAETEQAPSRYMLLISRVENMVRREQVEESTLNELRAYVASHLGAASEAGRQSIAGLKEFAALDAENIAELPAALVRAVRDPERAQHAFALLKQPTFSAYMRDDLRAQVYNPHGVLRAS